MVDSIAAIFMRTLLSRYRKTGPRRVAGAPAYLIAPVERPLTSRRWRARNTTTDGTVNTTAPDIMISTGVVSSPIQEARPTDVSHSSLSGAKVKAYTNTF